MLRCTERRNYSFRLVELFTETAAWECASLMRAPPRGAKPDRGSYALEGVRGAPRAGSVFEEFLALIER